jgi:hypothetical protein
MNIAAWLRGIGLEEYAPAFHDNRIDMRVLPKLTADDLKELGVTTIGDRRILLDAIAALREPTSHSAGKPAPAPPTAAAEAERRRSPSCSATSSARQPFRRGSTPKTCAR